MNDKALKSSQKRGKDDECYPCSIPLFAQARGSRSIFKNLAIFTKICKAQYIFISYFPTIPRIPLYLEL